MAQGYIFDKLLNRKIEGETNLAKIIDLGVITQNNLPIDTIKVGDIVKGTTTNDDLFVGVYQENTPNGYYELFGFMCYDNGASSQPVIIIFDDTGAYESTAYRGSLLKHYLEIDDNGTLHYFNCVSNSSEPISSMSSLISLLKSGSLIINYVNVDFVNDHSRVEGVAMISIRSSGLEVMLSDGGGGTYAQLISTSADVTDSVTPL